MNLNTLSETDRKCHEWAERARDCANVVAKLRTDGRSPRGRGFYMMSTAAYADRIIALRTAEAAQGGVL